MVNFTSASLGELTIASTLAAAFVAVLALWNPLVGLLTRLSAAYLVPERRGRKAIEEVPVAREAVADAATPGPRRAGPRSPSP